MQKYRMRDYAVVMPEQVVESSFLLQCKASDYQEFYMFREVIHEKVSVIMKKIEVYDCQILSTSRPAKDLTNIHKE